MHASWTERIEEIGSEGTRGRVLAVDDDILSARCVARVLERTGYVVDVVGNARDALERMQTARYDAIITDLAMPDMDGAGLISRGRALQHHAAFVVVTGLDEPGPRLRLAPEHSIVGVLQKPWAPNDLVDLARRAVDVGQSRASLVPIQRRVLLLEDAPAQVDLSREYLDEGAPEYDLVAAGTLQQALDLLAGERFDLVLTDLSLPDARGLDAVRRLVVAAEHVPLIAMSQSVDPAIGAQTLELGASDFLPKDALDSVLLRRSFDHAVLRQRSRRQLQELAFRDALTGLSNARHLRDRLALAVSRAQRARSACALIFIDLDGFKPVNDRFGHEAGDIVLQTVARRLDKEVRGSDTLARLGGDEFAILLEDVESDVAIAAITERLLLSIATPIPLPSGGEVHVSGSAGIALCPQCGDTPETLLRAADLSMYEAKARGPGRFAVAQGVLSSPRVARGQLFDGLREAAQRGEFALAFQPQLAAVGPRIVGMEALLRWRRDRKNIVEPSQFIPILEETELVHSVGLWVVDAACRQLAFWNGNGRSISRVSVNASPRQFEGADFAAEVLARVKSNGLRPDQLELEVTEGLLLKETDIVRKNLLALRASGVRLAVDDFGTGYASFSYLRRLEVNMVKIDRCFVQPLGEDPQAERLVAGMIEFAHKLGIEVAAEGVETVGQLNALRKLKCDVFQGYLCGKPVFGSVSAVGSRAQAVNRTNLSWASIGKPASSRPPPASSRSPSGSPPSTTRPSLASDTRLGPMRSLVPK